MTTKVAYFPFTEAGAGIDVRWDDAVTPYKGGRRAIVSVTELFRTQDGERDSARAVFHIDAESAANLAAFWAAVATQLATPPATKETPQ